MTDVTSLMHRRASVCSGSRVEGLKGKVGRVIPDSRRPNLSQRRVNYTFVRLTNALDMVEKALIMPYARLQ
jgi:hypothetical protein